MNGEKLSGSTIRGTVAFGPPRFAIRNTTITRRAVRDLERGDGTQLRCHNWHQCLVRGSSEAVVEGVLHLSAAPSS
jgi:hypothetical protein